MSKHVLIIEDEQLIYELLERKVKEAGYEVTLAHNGEEGVTQLRQRKPDIVLLDIAMPKMNGFEVMEDMQKDEELSSIPVIVISNSGQPVELNRAEELGATDWVIKADFDPQEIIEKVVSHIGQPATDTDEESQS